ncbi:2,3,4,5-tetrahydropyridine-2,6-dicarboxylate N-succinyltransferase [Pseudoclavibacter sp. RFBJ3]|uniref:2,3,4,5-tetrahydropyridine-2,6-dicarboxylate N-succinyltransferase n=1 Tax=unclassified Pseudoclavibacter TaxID=2615177 RepID=UPI000CE7D47E|nr:MULTISPECIES: 2,3,4,5-tetrahydropyridine-2,6-dicarboxylate N-succinyltransferase [unclassified Pseudoclavibacter]MBF4549769.1 2,3,4,5-tetrahydropyridine-2,6-dicarboxylate N-succinyltransferase [Pseudoclavibacter sp. VKM Ac-2888]PPF39735.1 2,3,4,5-tetrahydropyridine-2,6-dicarboxylate N-succinyltransferase [Pseudoclavibacter sp. AY1H1]PPF76188.1 2,3,4,5-tetrahydropyridine-2,6-dicarboxylate N-succinyltransferase [Pseudoclavibacter sp. Z016]PPF84726.1 2,3,4,5-tetrahydropyridine-2,6-dicarboxylate
MTNDAPTSHDQRTAWGDGLATITNDGQVLDAWFPTPALGPLPEGRDPHISPASFAALSYDDERRQVQVSPVTVTVRLDEPVESVVDAYLRLHLLSHLIVEPNSINLDGIFGHLPTNAWTNVGPMRPDLAASSRAILQREGIQVYAIDKFPRLLDYVMPADVRIADGGRVRLGAHLAPGTVVMHEGFVNFNAGTLGRSMVEGRVSQGVVLGAGSDIGGGASIMGTLSGGGKERIRIGERALLGANSGIGISLGDDSIVEAGLYVTAGTKVSLIGQSDPDGQIGEPQSVKASALSGVPNLLFRRNSVNGAVEALARTGAGIQLNDALHA